MTETISCESALELLRKHIPDRALYIKIRDHSQRVKSTCLELTASVSAVDRAFLETASMLHDIGRYANPPGSPESIRHGITGGRILRAEGLPAHAAVAERHIGVGITRRDIRNQGLPLPEDDFVPRSAEEMLVAYADNLDSPGVSGELDVEERFAREIGVYYRSRVRDFHARIRKLLGK
jgi:uncharacterized protein